MNIRTLNTRILGAAVAAALMLAAANAGADEFTVAVEPSFPPDQAAEIYAPLLQYLGQATGHTFKLETSRNYHFYWRDLRAGSEVDFAFEEPHFADYRIRRHGFEPLARTAEPTVYALIAQPDHAERGVNGLVGYRVVGMPSPSLGSVLLSQMYKNPLSQPEIKAEATSWREAVEIVFAGEGEAAIVPLRIAQLYPNLVELQQSDPLSGTVFVADGELAPEVKTAVRDALLALHENQELYDVLVEIGANKFEPATVEQVTGAQDLLRGVFGYKPPSP